jgi:hypothetical protein
MNPYRAAEYAFAGLCVAFVLAMFAALAWVITVTESWKGVGITILVLAVLFGATGVSEEWHLIEKWWVRKRDAWDSRREGSAPGDSNG